MLPYNSKPPQAVVELVREFHQNQSTRELVIFESQFLLYEKELSNGGPDQPTTVHVGKFIRRAYWRDATGMTLDQIKSILGI